MHDLVYEVKRMAERNRDGSLATQHDRKRVLMLCAEQLVELGYKQLRAADLKGRHVNKLVARWQAEGLSRGTIDNRLSALRYWAQKVGRVSILPRTNDVFHLPQRERIPRVSRARELPLDLSQVPDPYVRMSLELARSWGLRRKESLLMQPHQAEALVGFQGRGCV